MIMLTLNLSYNDRKLVFEHDKELIVNPPDVNSILV
jgi:hypothetical protein